MIDLITHKQTAEQIRHFCDNPSHAVLLIGTTGIGKTTLAVQLASQIIGITPEKLTQHPYFKVVAPEKSTISIENVRELQKFFQLKTLGDGKIRRAVIIEHAQTLTTEAQNAFLKLLEEPPADTIMILTVNNQRALLPTILSRVQTISVTCPAEADLHKFFEVEGREDNDIKQAYFLSGGLPGLMSVLLNGTGDEDKHPLVQAVSQAKTLLGQSTFERLATVETLSKQKDQAKYVVEALSRIAQTCIVQATAKGDLARIKQWHKILREATNATKAMSQNANTKLVLSNLMLNL